MTNVHTRKNRLIRTVTGREFGGLIGLPSVDIGSGESNPQPPGLVQHVTSSGQSRHTIWTPKLTRFSWDHWENKYLKRWSNWSCSFGEHVPRKIGELPDIHYTMSTTSRIHFQNPSEQPCFDKDMPTSRFGSTRVEVPVRGIIPDLPTSEYKPYKQ